MSELTSVDVTTVRTLAAYVGLELTPEQAATQAAVLQELLAVDAAIVALKLGVLTAVGDPWGAWADEAD